jgi:hypothetical protein
VTRSVLPFLLAGKRGRAEPNIENLNSEAVKRAARFSVGKEVNALRKAECILRLTHALRDGKRAAEVVAALRPEERAVLAVVRRYGGSISGVLLRRELLARGIIKEPKREELGYRRPEADPVLGLCERLVLIMRRRGEYSAYGDQELGGRTREGVPRRPRCASGPRPKAYEALRVSARLRPFLAGAIAPDCFVVAADKRDELSKPLGEPGFALDAACTLEAAALPAAPITLSKSRPALRRVPGSR